MVKIHSPDSGKKSQRNENRRNNRKYPHDFVCPDCDARKIKIHEIVGGITESFQKIKNNHFVIVTISKEELGSPLHQSGFVSHQAAKHIALWPNRPAQLGDGVSKVMQIPESLAGRIIKHRLLEFFHRVPKTLYQREVMIHDGIDESVCEVIGFHVPSIPGPLTQTLHYRVENISARFLLNRNNILSSQDHAHLFKNDIIFF